MSTSRAKKVGVLIVNLGSPEAPTAQQVRIFLREFLSDRRVVNLPRLLWWFILNFFILPFRPKKAAHSYQQIWTKRGSPLTSYTQLLSDKLAKKVKGESVMVEYAMRYGQPDINSRLRLFLNEDVEEFVVLPLYPQFSSTTTASVYDAIVEFFSTGKNIPSIRFISNYHDQDFYISAIGESIKKHWAEQGKNDILLMSFHGLPAKLNQLGDPYYQQCRKTACLVAEYLKLPDEKWQLVFQSRFGKAEWLKPYCVDVLQHLPQQGIKNVDIVCPGFAVDCLETLEEIAIANKQLFLEAGGDKYHYIPALNDSDGHVGLLHKLITEAPV